MWFLYGTGRNGKGVFLNTITRIMGDYAMDGQPRHIHGRRARQAFDGAGPLAGRASRCLAGNRGSRVPWAEARIKALTGGDPITANLHAPRSVHLPAPQFKLGMSGNHKPAR